MLHEGAGQEYALLLAARQLADLAVGVIAHAHLVERLEGVVVLLAARPADPAEATIAAFITTSSTLVGKSQSTVPRLGT